MRGSIGKGIQFQVAALESPRITGQFSRNLLAFSLHHLAYGNVADDPRVVLPIYQFKTAHSQIHGKYAAVLAPAANLSPRCANDARLASSSIVREITVMLAMIRLRHKHLDVIAKHFRA